MMSWPTVSAILLLVFTRLGTQFDAVGSERNKYRNEYRLVPGALLKLLDFPEMEMSL